MPRSEGDAEIGTSMPANNAKTWASGLLAEGKSGLLRVLETFARSQGHTEATTLAAMRSALSRYHDEHSGLLDPRACEAPRSLTASNISLVDDDTLSFSLQLAGFARRVRAHNESLLGHLQLRYMNLLERNDTTIQIPIGPETVCHALGALADAARMTTDERTQLVERAEYSLLDELHGFYLSFDERLSGAGINLKAFGKPIAQNSKAIERNTSALDTTDKLAPSVADQPTSGMSRLQQALMSRHYQSDAGATELAPELAASIMAQIRAWLSNPQQFGATQRPRLSSSHLIHLLAPRTAVAVEALEEVFARLADNVDLPPAIRHTIARLHIPLLKRTLADNQQLLADAEHPAHALIDALGVAGNMLPFANTGHPGYARIDAIVCGAIRDGEIGDGLLEAAQAEVQTFIDARAQQANACAERAIETMDKAGRREVARLLASRALGLFMDEQTAPAVRDFLCTCWIQVLVRTLYRLGDKHPDWRAQLEVANELVLSVQCDTSGTLSAERIANFPGLLARIEAPLAAIGFDARARQQALADCVALQSALISGQQHALPARSEPKPAQLVLSRASDDEALLMLHHVGYSGPQASAPGLLAALTPGIWVELDLPVDGQHMHGYLARGGAGHKTALIADPDSGKLLIVTMRAVAQLMHEQRFQLRNVASLTDAMVDSALNKLER